MKFPNNIQVLSALVLTIITGCGQLPNLKLDPPVKPSEWCDHQPCWQIGEITVNQPSSSILVFVLTALTLWLAYYFYKTRRQEASRFWWSFSLLLAGLGALFAGISFQAFAYEIKCKGFEYCNYTSYWEIAYNVFTVAGAAAMLIGIAHSFFKNSLIGACKIYAVVTTLCYIVLSIVGILNANKFLLSFEFMILFSLPPYLIILVYQLYHFTKKPSKLLIRYLTCWAILIFTFIAYSIYLANAYTEKLWASGTWWSANDVLHILMILWCLYIYYFLADFVQDKIDKASTAQFHAQLTFMETVQNLTNKK